MLTEQQLEERKSYLTGSDAAVICGLSPYKTRLQLWMEKTGRAEADDLSGLDHIKFGHYMEDGVARWFEDDSGKKLVKEERPMMIHKSLPWMAGNVDRFLVDENAILECKTSFRDDGWGNGENLIPAHYLMQVAHYCAVGAFDKAYIAVVFATTREMRWYVYERNLSLEEKLINHEQEFWINNVKADVAPEPMNEDDLLALYKTSNSSPIVAPSEIEEKIYIMKRLKVQSKSNTDQYEAIKQDVQMLMQEHDTLISHSGERLATWTWTKPGVVFEKESQEALEKDMPDIYKKYCKPGKAQRRFNIKVKE